MILLNRVNLKVREAAHKGRHRYTLNGVRFESDGSTVATDGRSFIRVGPAKSESVDDFPVQCGADAETDATEHAPFTISTAGAEKIEKAIPKDTLRPVLNHAALLQGETDNNGSAVFVVTDMETSQRIEIKKLDDDYVNLETCTPPSHTAKSNVRLDLDRLIATLRTVKAMLPKGDAYADFRLYGPATAVRIDARNENTEQDILAVMMPCCPDK